MKILYWFRRTARHLRKKPIPLRAVTVADAPDTLDPYILYLLGMNQNPWAAVFKCPCGCGATIELNLLAEVRPSWRAQKHWDSTISLWPSVNRMVGCRSHFWIKHGVIEWAFQETPRRR